MAITFQRASGSSGISHTIDIGTSGNDRLIIAVVGHESTPGSTFQGTVSVDGKNFTQSVVADNPSGVGNHLEVHTIDESVLGSSNGSLVVSYSAGDANWAIHVLVYYGVKNNNPVSTGTNETAIGNPVTVDNITSNDNCLIFMAAGDGSSGAATNWTTPLVERTDGPNPSSAILATASGIESTGQTNKSYSVTIGDGTLRSTGIVMVFDPYDATPPEIEELNNCYKIEQLVEQSTTSSSFIDIPGTTLTFTPENTSEIWMVFASGIIRSSSTSEQPYEMRLLIGGVEHDLWSHQNSTTSTPVGAGFLVFDRITSTTTEQTVKLQYRALSGTCYADDIRIVAAKVPDNADFQYYDSNNIVASLGSNLNVGSHTFTPSSTGNYFIICSIKHREYPSGSTSQVWFEGTNGVLHPNTSSIHHSNSRASWNPTTYIWREKLTAVSKTIKIRFTSSGPGSQNSEHRYRKIMAFREDAWDVSNYSLVATESSTTGSTFVQKNSITTTAPSSARDFLSIQTMRIGGNNSSSARKSGEIKIGGTTKVKSNHIINRANDAAQGYHHTVGLVDVQNTASAVTYQNGFSSPNAITVNCAESAIVVLRYPIVSQTHQMII